LNRNNVHLQNSQYINWVSTQSQQFGILLSEKKENTILISNYISIPTRKKRKYTLANELTVCMKKKNVCMRMLTF